jgi:predicted nucleic acid-binding protein
MAERFVLDNSVVMRWLFGDGSDADQTYAHQVLDAIAKGMALVPSLWGLEVANAIVRAESKRLLTEARSAEFVGLLQKMNIQVDSKNHFQTMTDTLQLARRYGLSSYDAAYLELALREGLPLATLDQKLRNAVVHSGSNHFLWQA